ncbi:holo-ACP synthase [Vreelandella azerica]|uniref:holo-ACP synthase n=1 Tax=Vreelandella azerica TaxID=2732867 RepID=UPI002E2DD007|nr:holo-ACP synthase [Halomonas azerica]
MIVGIGSDIARVGRFEQAMARHGERFAQRILGPEEQQVLASQALAAGYLAKRFAAKEAFVKALGSGLRHGIQWGISRCLTITSANPTCSSMAMPRHMPKNSR